MSPARQPVRRQVDIAASPQQAPAAVLARPAASDAPAPPVWVTPTTSAAAGEMHTVAAAAAGGAAAGRNSSSSASAQHDDPEALLHQVTHFQWQVFNPELLAAAAAAFDARLPSPHWPATPVPVILWCSPANSSAELLSNAAGLLVKSQAAHSLAWLPLQFTSRHLI